MMPLKTKHFASKSKEMPSKSKEMPSNTKEMAPGSAKSSGKKFFRNAPQMSLTLRNIKKFK
jgi:hypothetical protein